jgi:hypothetical protein
LFDAEQLVYLMDPNLHFLTADRGYLRKVLKSPFRDRIHEVPSAVLADAASLASLLKQITCAASPEHARLTSSVLGT